MIFKEISSNLHILMAITILCVSSGYAKDNCAPNKVNPIWIQTWGSSPYPPFPSNRGIINPAPIKSQTLRQHIRVSVGGQQLRIRLSNEFGKEPLRIGAATVALLTKDGSVEPKSLHSVTFGGSSSIDIPPGAPALSDAVDLDVKPLSQLAISLFFPDETVLSTIHMYESLENHVSIEGDYTASKNMPVENKLNSYAFLSGVDVLSVKSAGVIVALGDSITDGASENNSWPSRLAELLSGAPVVDRLSLPMAMAVVNSGIGGNTLMYGEGALARFDRDVLAVSGVTHIILLEGINDIGVRGLRGPNGNLWQEKNIYTANDIVIAYKQLIARAHAHNLKIYGGVLTPFAGTTQEGYYSSEKEKIRQAVNLWIRTSNAFDAVIDFDAAIRDPEDSSKLLPIYDSGDHLHPGGNGYSAMAVAVKLSLFDPLSQCLLVYEKSDAILH